MAVAQRVAVHVPRIMQRAVRRNAERDDIVRVPASLAVHEERAGAVIFPRTDARIREAATREPDGLRAGARTGRVIPRGVFVAVELRENPRLKRNAVDGATVSWAGQRHQARVRRHHGIAQQRDAR